MNTKKKIYKELKNKVPDISNQVVKSIDWNSVKEQNLAVESFKSEQKTKKMNIFKVALSSLCLLFVVAITFLVPNFSIQQDLYNSSDAMTYALTIDVNPCVRVYFDSNNIVTKQEGLNKDGVILLYKENLIGKNIESATKFIVDKLNQFDFIKTNKQLSFSIKDEFGKTCVEKQNNALNKFDNYLKSNLILNGTDVNLKFLNEQEIDEIENLFDSENITTFEKELVTEFSQRVKVLLENKKSEIQNILNILDSVYLTPTNFKAVEISEEKQKILQDIYTKCGFTIDFDINSLNIFKIKEIKTKIDDKKDNFSSIDRITLENFLDYLDDLIDLQTAKLLDVSQNVNLFNDFITKYNIKLNFNILNKTTAKNLIKFKEELEETYENIKDINIIESEDEDDYEDFLEDIFDILEEILFEEN